MLPLIPYVAAMRRPDARATHADSQEVRLRTPVPGDDWPLTFVLPAPRALVVGIAHALADSGVEAFRDSTGRPVVRGTDGRIAPLDVELLRREVLATFAGLTGSHYYAEALRRVAEVAPVEAEAYVARVLALLGRTRVLRNLPADRSARPTALSPAERKARSRAQIAEWESETVEAFLAWWLDSDDAPAPGESIAVRDLKDYAVAWIEDAVDAFEAVRQDRAAFDDDLAAWRCREKARGRAERSGALRPPPALPKPREPETWLDVMCEEDYPEHPRQPGRTRLGALLAQHLGAPQHRRDGDFYTIPKPDPTKKETQRMPNLEELQAEAEAYREAADAGARLLTIRERLAAGDRLGALTRGGYVATGTDGSVVDLATHRARRS